MHWTCSFMGVLWKELIYAEYMLCIESNPWIFAIKVMVIQLQRVKGQTFDKHQLLAAKTVFIHDCLWWYVVFLKIVIGSMFQQKKISLLCQASGQEKPFGGLHYTHSPVVINMQFFLTEVGQMDAAHFLLNTPDSLYFILGYCDPPSQIKKSTNCKKSVFICVKSQLMTQWFLPFSNNPTFNTLEAGLNTST